MSDNFSFKDMIIYYIGFPKRWVQEFRYREDIERATEIVVFYESSVYPKTVKEGNKILYGGHAPYLEKSIFRRLNAEYSKRTRDYGLIRVLSLQCKKIIDSKGESI